MAYRGMILCVLLLAGVALGQSFLTPFDTSLLQLANNEIETPFSGLLIYYDMTSTNDLSGNSYDGELLGDAYLQNSLMYADGTGDVMDSGYNLSTNAFSMMFFAKFDTLTGYQVCGSSDTANNRRCYVGPLNGDVLAIGAGDYTSGQAYAFVADTWYHFALICDGSVARAYVNGVFVAQAAYSYSGTSIYPIGVGGSTQKTTDNIDGVIDSYLFYNRAITTNELQIIFNKGHD